MVCVWPAAYSCWAWPCNRASRPVAVGEAQPRTRCLARMRCPLLDRTCDSVTTTSVASHDEPPKSEQKEQIQQDGKPWTKTMRIGKRAWATEGSGVADRTGVLHSNPRYLTYLTYPELRGTSVHQLPRGRVNHEADPTNIIRPYVWSPSVCSRHGKLSSSCRAWIHSLLHGRSAKPTCVPLGNLQLLHYVLEFCAARRGGVKEEIQQLQRYLRPVGLLALQQKDVVCWM